MRKILLTGASGFLGSNFCKIYSEDFDIHAVWNTHEIMNKNVNAKHLDISHYDSLTAYFRILKPDVVIHLGAYSDPNRCQLNPEISEKINIESTENIAVLCEEAK